MPEKLTETLIKGLIPPACGERYVYDAEVTGFAVKLFAPTKATPKGARTFVLVYRRSGALRRFRIGCWPEWSVTAARAEAREIRQRVDRGEDPAGVIGAKHRPWPTSSTATSLNISPASPSRPGTTTA
jgi:hypothetical protein